MTPLSRSCMAPARISEADADMLFTITTTGITVSTGSCVVL